MLPTRGRECPTCGNNFCTSFPTVSNPLSLLRPMLQYGQLTFLAASLPAVEAAFEGMDHLAEESDLLTL